MHGDDLATRVKINHVFSLYEFVVPKKFFSVTIFIEQNLTKEFGHLISMQICYSQYYLHQTYFFPGYFGIDIF